MKKALPILNGIALTITIVINYLSNTGVFNGKTMASVSAQYENLLTPAGYAFSIWGLIYVGLILFVAYSGRSLFIMLKKDQERAIAHVGWWFIISCTANSLWVVMWLYEYTLISVVIMIILMFSLLKIVVKTNMQRYAAPLKTIIFIWWPFSIYAGWVSVALVANIAAYLTKENWNGFKVSETIWAVVLIAVIVFLHIAMIWKRNMREFALVAVWALIAIGIANQNRNLVVYQTAIVAGVIIFINISIHAFQNKKSNRLINKIK